MLEQLRSRTMITTRSGVILRTHIAGKDFRTQLLYNERHNYDTEKLSNLTETIVYFVEDPWPGFRS